VNHTSTSTQATAQQQNGKEAEFERRRKKEDANQIKRSKKRGPNSQQRIQKVNRSYSLLFAFVIVLLKIFETLVVDLDRCDFVFENSSFDSSSPRKEDAKSVKIILIGVEKFSGAGNRHR
jgi:hypothetical protein